MSRFTTNLGEEASRSFIPILPRGGGTLELGEETVTIPAAVSKAEVQRRVGGDFYALVATPPGRAMRCAAATGPTPAAALRAAIARLEGLVE